MAKNTVNLDDNVKWFAEKTNELNKKSRQKDRDSKINIEKVNKEEKKANETGYTIVKIKDKNKAPFSMFIDGNLSYLICKKKYLKSHEKAFLLDISPFVQMNSNILVDAIYNGKNNEFEQTNNFVTVTKLADTLNLSISQLKKTLKSLIDKGIIFELLTSEHIEQIKQIGHITSERMLIVNPEILFKGDRNKIDTSVCTIILNMDKLEKNNIKLPWKVWRDINAQHGKLYRRDTYTKKKNILDKQQKESRKKNKK